MTVFSFWKVHKLLNDFIVDEVSAFYCDIVKDRLYTESSSSLARRSAQTVLVILLENLTKALSPIACYLTEEVAIHLPSSVRFSEGWMRKESKWHRAEIEPQWKLILQIRDHVNSLLEAARGDKLIGSSLAAQLRIGVSSPVVLRDLAALGQELNDIMITSHTSLSTFEELTASLHLSDEIIRQKIGDTSYVSVASLTHPAGEAIKVCIEASVAKGNKCLRCWKYHNHSTDVCPRCAAIIGLHS